MGVKTSFVSILSIVSIRVAPRLHREVKEKELDTNDF